MPTKSLDQNGKICLGVATLGNPHPKFVAALVQTALGDVFENFCILSGALLPFSRNELIKKFYANDPDFTHIMFIDDDMTNFTAYDVVELVNADKPIISGLLTFRSLPYKPINYFKDIETLKDVVHNKKIIEVDHTGMAFTLIKKEVLDAMREEIPPGSIWFTMDREPRDSFDVEVEQFVKQHDQDIMNSIAFGQNSHIGSMMLGEDYSFCKKAKKLGFQTWVHGGVVIGHIGDHVFDIKEALGDTPTFKLDS